MSNQLKESKMKLRLFISLILAISLFALPALAADAKIAYIDLQRALNECKAGKTAKDKITTKYKQLEGQFAAKQKELKKLKDELEKQGSVLSADAKTEKERQYQQKVKDFQRFAKDARDTLKQQETDFSRDLIKELVLMARDMGSQGNYTLILEKNEGSIIYGAKEVDLTEQLIRRHDQKK
ncbi:MAG: OmpH family outer membrane protein [Desulfuromonadaceae bacterium]|nr:OmpH family outer membrane protein [Desulfuromonadaceae bacterium]